MAKKTTSKSSKTAKSTAKPDSEKQHKKAADAGDRKPAAKKAAAKKAAAEKEATAPDAASPQPKAAAKTSKVAPRARDPRLPEPGTVLQKKDRQGMVRCECTVEKEGIRYQGMLYRSLSAAAMAASKDMGLGGRAQNGYLFWGIIKQPARESDPVAALERAWERYESRAKGIVAADLSDEAKAKVQSVVREHAAILEGLQRQAG